MGEGVLMNWLDGLLLALLILCILLVIWPFTLYPMILRALPPQALSPDPSGPPFSASLLFCAYNEAASLPAKIANLRALKALHPDLQILAFDDGSSDGTGDMLAGASDVLTLVRGPGRSGKAHGMKRLAALATSDILIFSDANVLLD